MSNDFRALPLGHILSDFRIEGILGQGGFGITYLAIDTMLNRRVAIKEYFPREFAVRDTTLTVHSAGNSEDREFFKTGLQRFLEEARVLALFDHSNIVGVRRFFEANGTAYLVMDYCDGEPLDEFLKRNGPLNNQQLNKILLPLLDGLEKIHNANFLHRDIKPANIFIREDGSPVLLDFGAARQEIASHSRSVTSFATEGYAAVEQYSTRGKQGPYTDIYGFGATLYRAITDIKPQGAPDRILQDSLELCSNFVAGKFDKNILKGIDAAIKVRPEDRPQSIKEWKRVFGISDSPSAVIPVEQKKNSDHTLRAEKIEFNKIEKEEQKIAPSRTNFRLILSSVILMTVLIVGYGLSKTSIFSSATVKPTPLPGIQGGSSTAATKEPWETAVEAIIARQKAGKISESTTSSVTSFNSDELKGTLSGYSPLPSSDVAKIEENNVWYYYEKPGKFFIRLLNPTNQRIDKVVLRFTNSCEGGGNVRYALLGLKKSLEPGQEVLYSSPLPMAGGFSLSGYKCAVVEGAYSQAKVENQQQTDTSSIQTCPGSYSSAWTNCFGTQTFASGSQWAGQKYTGTFLDGKRSGKGTYSWPNGDKYTGEFRNNTPNGQGTFTWGDGSSYTGGFKDGLKSGSGTQKWANGTKYVGEYKNDVRDGKGTLYAADGSVISTGVWSGGVFNNSSPSRDGTGNVPSDKVADLVAACNQVASVVNKDKSGKMLDNITRFRSSSCYKNPGGNVVFVYKYELTTQDVFTPAQLNAGVRPGRVKQWCTDKELRPLLDMFDVEDAYYAANGALMGTLRYSKTDCK